MFDLEKDLPDELMGGPWGEQPGVPGPKPPAQGLGPGQMAPQQQLNGDDPAAAMHRQINNHLLQVSTWDCRNWLKFKVILFIVLYFKNILTNKEISFAGLFTGQQEWLSWPQQSFRIE